MMLKQVERERQGLLDQCSPGKEVCQHHGLQENQGAPVSSNLLLRGRAERRHDLADRSCDHVCMHFDTIPIVCLTFAPKSVGVINGVVSNRASHYLSSELDLKAGKHNVQHLAKTGLHSQCSTF
eukprot:39165_1